MTLLSVGIEVMLRVEEEELESNREMAWRERVALKFGRSLIFDIWAQSLT